jgi:predicted dinucleotide-binding enzyme
MGLFNFGRVGLGFAQRVDRLGHPVGMELALEQAFLAVACEETGQSVEGFKKKHAGGRRTRR